MTLAKKAVGKLSMFWKETTSSPSVAFSVMVM